MDEFAAWWDELDDPRTGNAGLHDFHELLFIALCSLLCGGQGAVDMALFAKSKVRWCRFFGQVFKLGSPMKDGPDDG